MASPPVDQRATGGRSTIERGTTPAESAKPAAAPKPPNRGSVPIAPVDPLASCRGFITIDPEASDTATGTGVHRVIREQVGAYIMLQGYGAPVRIRLPDASFDHYRDKNHLTIGNKGSGNGDVDLAFRSRAGNVMLVAEVKPANWEAFVGETQLANYIEKANANGAIKRRFNVSEFSLMRPDDAMLPPEVIYIGRRFEIRWCGKGMIVYKEIGKEKKEKDQQQKQDERQSSGAQANEQAKRFAKGWAEQVHILGSAPRRLEFQGWVPEPLRRAIQEGTLADGLYRNRFSASWPSGYSTNVVVWVKTVRLGGKDYREYQYYQEFPADPAFYQYLADRNGLSNWQRDLVRSTLVQYNDDLWSLIAPDPETGMPSSRSPYYARDELRTIYAGILKDVVSGSARILGAGAGITGVSNAMRQRATEGRSIASEKEATPTKEAPLPDWVNKAVQKGADLYKQRQGVPVVVP